MSQVLTSTKTALEGYPTSLQNAVSDPRSLKKFKDAGTVAGHLEEVTKGVTDDSTKVVPDLLTRAAAAKSTLSALAGHP